MKLLPGRKRWKRQDKALGISEARRYDIPLDRGPGRWFGTILISLMVFLATLSLSAALALHQFSERWETGLEGRWTIELPGLNPDTGALIGRADLLEQAKSLRADLESFHAVEAVEIIPEEEVKALLEPWFPVQTDAEAAIPLPVLLSLTMRSPGPESAQAIEQLLQESTLGARLDRHEDWLAQLMVMTGTLQSLAFLFTALILSAAAIAIAGTVQARMAEHKEIIQLLHLMGAADSYITRQFQRHGIFTAARGALIGLITGGLVLWLIGSFYPAAGTSQLPRFEINEHVITALLALPFATVLVAVLVTRATVLRTLQRMP